MRDRSLYHIVVLAADCIGSALSTAHADDGDGRAIEAKHDAQALDDDAEQAKEKATRRGAGL